MKCDECLPRIEEYVDGELDGRTMERIAAHLSTCESCATEVTELQRDAEIYAQYRRDLEVTPAQWNIVRARIEQEKDSSLSNPATRLHEHPGVIFGSGRRFRPAFAAALLLIIIGIAAGVIYLNSRQRQVNLVSQPTKPNETLPIGGATPPASFPEGNKNPESIAKDKDQREKSPNEQTTSVADSRTGMAGQKSNAIVKVSAPRSRDRARKIPLDRIDATEPSASGSNFTPLARRLDFDSEVARHSEKAELLLRSFRNVRLPANTRSLDVSYEKEQSRRLLYQNIALRRDAATRGDEPTAALLNKLEPILLDIANLPGRARSRDVRSIEQRMEKKEIVATLQVRTLVAAN